jgi:Ran GTPase-activating protein (RanGAP) involved in mRNA processing and transport
MQKNIKGELMLFLIEYDRNQGQIITFKKFNAMERQNAEGSRLEMELNHNRLGTEREVVILEADSEEALRRTHRRYFESLTELVNAPA